MFYFTTFFDKNYLPRGLVLYDSIKEHSERFELYVLCLDEFTLGYFQQNQSRYPEVKAFPLSDIEQYSPDLKSCKNNRSTMEYYFTLSPCLPLYLLKKFQLAHICSLDADIMFYSSPKPLFEHLNNYSIIITPHKFAPELKSKETYGKYNVSFQIFRNDEHGIACLEKWQQQCIEWCGDIYDEKNNRYADQKYLDNWTELYPGRVKELYDSVSGLAIWNVNNYNLTCSWGKFYSDSERLIFYHYHDFKLLGGNWALNGFKPYEVKPTPVLDKLYLKYWNRLDRKNSVLGVKKDVSARFDLSHALKAKLSYEVHVYFKLFSIKVLHINYREMNERLKRIIHRIYG